MVDTKKQERLKDIKIIVSPLPQKQSQMDMSDEHKILLRDYRAWAWARHHGLIIRTGRGR